MKFMKLSLLEIKPELHIKPNKMLQWLLQQAKDGRTGYTAVRCTIRCARRLQDGKANWDSEEANKCHHIMIRLLSFKIQRNNSCEHTSICFFSFILRFYRVFNLGLQFRNRLKRQKNRRPSIAGK